MQNGRIAELNDLLRKTFTGGRIVITAGIAALPESDQAAILAKVQAFDAFSPDNNPHGQRDFGSFSHNGARVFWKVDYYDPFLTFGSEDPADPAKTARVLTIMLALEY
jgi:Protein of unknown function (DUF3768)